CRRLKLAALIAPPINRPVPTRTMAADTGRATRRACRSRPRARRTDSACTEIVCRVIAYVWFLATAVQFAQVACRCGAIRDHADGTRCTVVRYRRRPGAPRPGARRAGPPAASPPAGGAGAACAA